MYELIFYDDDDRVANPETALARTTISRKVPHIGEGITLVVRDGTTPRRFRVVDVDHAYTAQNHEVTFKDSTVSVFIVDANDPRRTGK